MWMWKRNVSEIRVIVKPVQVTQAEVIYVAVDPSGAPTPIVR
jgi:hypothetical protein